MRNTAIALLTLVLVLSCASATSDGNRQAEQANARTSIAAAMKAADEPQLAVEVEFTASGVTPVDATIIRAPRRANAAIADLRVDAATASYTITDPRLAEIEGETNTVLPSARAFVHVPLSPSLGMLTIQPIAKRNAEASRGGSFDLRPLAVSACRKQEQVLPACREILAQQPPPVK